MNQLPENSLCIYDVTLVASYLIGLCQREPKVPGLYKKHTTTQPVMPEIRLEPPNVCLID